MSADPNSLEARRRSGWVTFAGVMLILAGAIKIFDALWSFRYSGDVNEKTQTIIFERSLTSWGWVWLLLGIVLILGGIYTMRGKVWASLVGMVLAGISAVLALPWMYYRPVGTVVVIILCVLVMYGLAVNVGTEVR
jgi:hypothetical protein